MKYIYFILFICNVSFAQENLNSENKSLDNNTIVSKSKIAVLPTKDQIVLETPIELQKTDLSKKILMPTGEQIIANTPVEHQKINTSNRVQSPSPEQIVLTTAFEHQIKETNQENIIKE